MKTIVTKQVADVWWQLIEADIRDKMQNMDIAYVVDRKRDGVDDTADAKG